MNLYKQSSPQCNQLFSGRNSLNDRQLNPNPNHVADGFDIWWHKTFAQNKVVVAQASALMRAHRRVSAASESRAGFGE